VVDRGSVLFVCESYYLKFYQPLADRLSRSGYRPVWVTLDDLAPWNHDYIDPGPAIETLVDSAGLACREDIDALCVFERAVFNQPALFKDPYKYTTTVVRTYERARRLAEVWYRATLALLARFAPRAVFVWNGRYLPYSAVSAACQAAGQLLLTNEIGWIPGTVLLDRGPLATGTADLLGRTFDAAAAEDQARADAFLDDYRNSRATMVPQTLVSAASLRDRLLGASGGFLLVYGCQVDWDTNIVIGARRFRSNEAAVSFLMDAISAIPEARLIVKTHPLDAVKNEARLGEILGGRGVVVSDVHPHPLIEAADCVAVRNSTLGFETLCYRKPLLLLEDAKYRHRALTLDAPDVATAASSLVSVSGNRGSVPDPAALRQFVLHLLDRYLLPVRYEYFFEPAKLDLLSHFARSESHHLLARTLSESVPPSVADVDDGVVRVLVRCPTRRRRRRSFAYRQFRKLADWIS
jgi:hypothetical protein